MMEIGLKRLEGVDKVAISIERQQFVVLYKPNAVFQPDMLRAAVAESGVEVNLFHVQVRGKVEKQPTGRVLTAGRDKYSITADSKEVPLATELVITGDITNDRKPPYQLKIVDFKPAGAAGAAAPPASSQPSKAPAKK